MDEADIKNLIRDTALEVASEMAKTITPCRACTDEGCNQRCGIVPLQHGRDHAWLSCFKEKWTARDGYEKTMVEMQSLQRGISNAKSVGASTIVRITVFGLVFLLSASGLANLWQFITDRLPPGQP